jgi:cytochrome c biogenesis protein CcmG, thiol:disulfide interchange protein DsbE
LPMIYRIIAIIVIILATVVYSIQQKKSIQENLVSDAKSESVLASLPDVIFETLEKKPFSLAEFYQTQAPGLVMVHFWGTWCAPCEAELPELLSLINHFQAQPQIKFLLVAVNDEVVKVEKHLKKFGVSTKANVICLLDNQNVYRDMFGTTRVPETFVFSSDKTTLRKFIGPQNWNKSTYFQTFDELLQISSRKL